MNDHYSLMETKRYGECKSCGKRVHTPEEVAQHRATCPGLRAIEDAGMVGWKTGEEVTAVLL